jgi:hypothetical protein
MPSANNESLQMKLRERKLLTNVQQKEDTDVRLCEIKIVDYAEKAYLDMHRIL